jgi:hypothetical protein
VASDRLSRKRPCEWLASPQDVSNQSKQQVIVWSDVKLVDAYEVDPVVFGDIDEDAERIGEGSKFSLVDAGDAKVYVFVGRIIRVAGEPRVR